MQFVLPQQLRLFHIYQMTASGKSCRIDVLLANFSTNLPRLDLYRGNGLHGYDGILGN